MIINDRIKKIIGDIVGQGLAWLENTEKYYEILHDRETSRFIVENLNPPPHFKFLNYVIDNPRLSKCPECGHCNPNIDCPSVICEYCNTHFIILTKMSKEVCIDCSAYKTKHCKIIPETIDVLLPDTITITKDTQHGTNQSRKAGEIH